MKTDKIRSSFLEFFGERAHKVVSSDSLVSPDPTLLFTSAGMNQFKDFFLGKNLTYTKACSCQKCLRMDDLDKVGKTPGHHTFFEMLGNFSFGDYFKKEAIKWAWEYLTEVLELKATLLWASVYERDDEAYSIWKDEIKLPQDKIVKLGPTENFWPANVQKKGPNGPCGPCSEIFFDQGPEVGCGKPDCNPGCECDRFVEVWNLVFTQFERKNGGILELLPMKNIDTGMGLERIAAVMQGVRSNFEIDIFKPIVEAIKDMSQEPRAKSKIYAIADHIRAIVFAISDGVAPSSDERGYVVRKLINKASRHGKELGIESNFLADLVPIVIKTMESGYPELKDKKEEVIKIIKQEEEKKSYLYKDNVELKIDFTGKTGDFIIHKEGEKDFCKPVSLYEKNGKLILSGKDIFELYDTWGIPLELIEEACASMSLVLDMEEYESLMEKQRDRSRQRSKIKDSVFSAGKFDLSHLPKTEFVGYESSKSKSKVLAIIKEDKFIDFAKKEDEVFIVLDKTPFYAEAGGQVGDKGKIFNDDLEIEVVNTVGENDYVLHESKILKGKVEVSDRVIPKIDSKRRLDIARNHTATHLLHSALRKVLGTHVKQSGSLVAEEKLRFDFSHFKSLTSKELDRVELLVNKKIRQDKKVSVQILEKKEAEREGALAFFKQRYKEKVRVVNISGFSKELCGGTHLDRTGQIGLFKIINETSVASGIRRIEAITGERAYNYFKKTELKISKLSDILKVERSDLIDVIKEKLELIKSLENKVRTLNKKIWRSEVDELVNNAYKLNNIKIINHRLPSIDMSGLGEFLDLITNNYKSCIAVVGTTYQNKALLVTGVSEDLLSKNYNAAEIIKKIAKLVNGSGGGKASFAQAGGRNVAGLDKALRKSIEIISDYINEATT